MHDVEVVRRTSASPERVWQLLADPTRMGRWSPEAGAGRWLDGATGPAIGARWSSANRHGWHRWRTTCTLTAHDPGRALAWDVSSGPLQVASWGYRIEVEGATTVVLEHFDDRRGALLRGAGPLIRGVRDVEGHNRRGMEETLRRLCEAAEGAEGG